MIDLNEILAQHNLKKTGCRKGILEVIYKAGKALSEQEIRERLEGNYDRSTFYRSFKTLQDSHILHKIVVDNNLVKYALDASVTNQAAHAHFYCTICETVKCLDEIPIKTPNLPGGFRVSETEMIIKGYCNYCGKKKDEI